MNEKLNLLLTQLSSVIFGKERECRLTVCALLAGGDLLVEDVPGVGKTTLALALAQSLDLSFGRIQFTPRYLAQRRDRLQHHRSAHGRAAVP